MGWLSGWDFRKELTVQDTNVDGNLIDFPVYVKIDSDADFHEARADGYDIRFTQSDGTTLLKYERERWTGGNGSAATAHFWVKVPSILSSGGATIYIYYGKSGATDGEDAENVWDANFKGVWHMLDATTSTIADSTSNGKDGTKIGANEPIETLSGKIDRAQDFDGGNDRVSIASFPRPTSAITLSAWINCDDVNSDVNQIVSADDVFNGNAERSWQFRLVRWTGRLDFIVFVGGTPYTATMGSANLGGAWHHVVGVYNGETSYIYEDGALTDSDGSMSGNLDGGTGVAIGTRSDEYSYNEFNGKIDEVRITNDVRTAEEIKFEYYNMNESDQELTWANEEAVPTYIPKIIMVA